MFQGTGVALITPFKEDLSIDYSALEQLVESVIAGGVEFLVALGTTAETPTLSEEEKLAVLNFILKVNNRRLPVVAGIGGNNTQKVIETIQKYPLAELAGILSVVPYYNKPNQEAIYQHFKAIAESTTAEIILYNVPGRTATNMEAVTTLRLAKDYDNIVAVKEASGNMKQCMELIKEAPEDFAVLSGDDDLILAQMSIGFKGVISVAGNSFPSTFSQMIRLAANNHYDEARKLHYQMIEGIHLLFAEGNPTGVKALLNHKGLCLNRLRLPLIPASDSLQHKIEAFKTID
jgi:4-hydroxy-tetrahydrodipicolinate synthase